MLKIAQILRSPASISSFATCLQSVSLCFHPIHSHPVKEKKKAAINPIQSSFWVKSPFSYIFLCFNRVNPGYNRVMYVIFQIIFKSLFMAVELAFFINGLRPGSTAQWGPVSGIFAASAWRALSHGPPLSSAAKKPLPRWHIKAGQYGQWLANNWKHNMVIQ